MVLLCVPSFEGASPCVWCHVCGSESAVSCDLWPSWSGDPVCERVLAVVLAVSQIYIKREAQRRESTAERVLLLASRWLALASSCSW